MKHLFLIHSHTTFLTALGVIEHEKLQKEDVLLAFSRNYKTSIPHEFESIDISEMTEQSFYMALSLSRHHYTYDRAMRDRVVAYFDDLVDKRIGGAFMLYCCHLQAFTCQILATNKHCVECRFIQEGGRIMYPMLTDRIGLFNRLYNKIVLRNECRFWKAINWFPNKNTPYDREVKAYAIDPDFFADAASEVILVEWPHLNVNLDLDTTRPIFTLEGAVELGQIEAAVYYTAVKKLIEKYAKESNYIKFHPKQESGTRAKIIEMFTKIGKTVEQLPDDVPFELIVSSFRGLTCVGFGTSLLFYAKSMGHTVISEEDELKKHSARYRHYAANLAKL